MDATTSAYIGGRTAISPDGRFLVIANSMIRVWDLQTLPDNLYAHAPLQSYTGPLAFVSHVVFISDTIIETTTCAGEVSRWDILTGLPVTD